MSRRSVNYTSSPLLASKTPLWRSQFIVALVALANVMLGAFWIGGEALSVERILGVIFSPVAWLIGVEWADAQKAGWLLGVFVVFGVLPRLLLALGSLLAWRRGLQRLGPSPGSAAPRASAHHLAVPGSPQ